MSDVLCDSCSKPMNKTGTMHSGNSQFLEYSCTGCYKKKTVCQGLSSLASI